MKTIRYETVSKSVLTTVKTVKHRDFPELEKAKIQVFFDTRMCKKGGKLCLGRIMRSNDLIRKLTDNIVPAGCDYILFMDKIAYNLMSEKDRERLIRHELRHIKYSPGTKKVWGLVAHDIEDFEVEIELNKDDVGWAKKVVKKTIKAYREKKKEEKHEREQ